MFFSTCLLKILNMSLTASAVIIFVLLLRLLLKKAPKVISYALWGVVLFRLLCPVSLESSLSLFSLFNTPTVNTSERTSTVEYIPSEIIHTEFPQVVLPVSGANEVITETFPQGKELLVSDPLEAPMAIVTYVWLSGILVMGIYGTVAYLRLRRKLLTASPLRGNIYLADEISSPFVMGLIRPKIYLPSEMEPREQSYIILHEQHHIRRLDHIVKALAFLALCIHWFNPLVWLAFILAGKDMEMSCDEAVVKKLGEGVRAEYAASLLSLATGRRIIAGTPLAFGEGNTKDRIKNLANWKKPAFWAVLVAAIACIALSVCLLTNPSASVDAELSVFIDCEIASHHQTEHSKDHFCCLDWEVLGKERNGDQITVYMWVFYREYSNENGLTVKTGAHIPTAITAEQVNGSYRLVEYWEPQDGSYYPSSIKEKFPIYLWSRAFNSQRYSKKQSATLEQIAKEHFASTESQVGKLSNITVVPGTTYVSWQCLYMNPLSSYYPGGGDSGCKYVIGEDYFATIQRNDGSFVSVTHPELDTAGSGLQNMVKVPQWEWQEFPYTDEEWAALYQPAGFGGWENISEIFDEILYQPLTAGKFLLLVDGALWLVDLASNQQMGTYLWSIYSLVPESAMGVAQWEYAPILSSRLPVFRFEFDMDYDEISAVCTQSDLVDFDTAGAPSDSALILQEGTALYWSPLDKNDVLVTYANIHFSVHKDDTAIYAGTIYIEAGASSDGRTVYTASLVGTGLHLSPNPETEGGVISAVSISSTGGASPSEPVAAAPVEYDLTSADLRLTVGELGDYIFFTNSEQIAVEVQSETDFNGSITLRDVSQANAKVGVKTVSRGDNNALFTGLTSARLYRLTCEDLEGCTLVISGTTSRWEKAT